MLERPETWGQQLVEIMIQWQGGVRSLPLNSMALYSQVGSPTHYKVLHGKYEFMVES